VTLPPRRREAGRKIQRPRLAGAQQSQARVRANQAPQKKRKAGGPLSWVVPWSLVTVTSRKHTATVPGQKCQNSGILEGGGTGTRGRGRYLPPQPQVPAAFVGTCRGGRRYLLGPRGYLLRVPAAKSAGTRMCSRYLPEPSRYLLAPRRYLLAPPQVPADFVAGTRSHTRRYPLSVSHFFLQSHMCGGGVLSSI